MAIRPIDMIMDEGLLSPIGVRPAAPAAQSQVSLLGASVPPSSYMAPQAATMPMPGAAPQSQASQPYDDAIMRNARGIGLPPTGLLGQTPSAPAAQQQKGLFGDFFGTSFEDPRTRRNLAGAAALLEAGGPQMRPVGTGQAVGMGINAMLGQQNEINKLKKATARGFEARGPVVRKGTNDYLGEAVFNPTTGQLMLSTPSGELIPLPADAEPTVKSALSGERLSGQQMVKLAGEVRNSENTLRKLNEYLSTQGGTNQGFQRMGDELIANLKTFFGTNDLTPEQLNQLIVKGQAQAILGGMRVATVGPGVMTEQDAARVLAAIGGNPDALQNPAVMGRLIRDAFEYQYNVYDQQYEDLALAYDFYGRPMRDKLLNPFDVSGSIPSSQGNVGFTILPDQGNR